MDISYTLNDVIGNKKQIQKISEWLQIFKQENPKINSDFKNALLILGPSGSGKTFIIDLLLEKYKFDKVEFNSSEIRTSKELNERIISILSGKSIKSMFFNNSKSAIVLDEIGSIDSKKEFSANDLVDHINYQKDKFYKNKLTKKKNRSQIINKNPIILISETITKNISSVKDHVTIINIDNPQDYSITEYIKKKNIYNNLNLKDSSIQIIQSFSQNDFRRAYYLLELVSSYINSNPSYNNKALYDFLNKLGNKDINYNILESVNHIFFDQNSSVDEMINCYQIDTNSISYICYENYINFIDSNTLGLNYSDKLDKCLEFYNNYLTSMIFKKNTFGNWILSDFSGLTYSMGIKNSLENIKIKSNNFYFNKSSVVSKYNYRYYNLKYINYYCKKLNIDLYNFDFISYKFAYSVFIDKTKLSSTIKIIKHKYKMESKDLIKIIKLSVLFDKHKNIVTKKFENDMEELFLSF